MEPYMPRVENLRTNKIYSFYFLFVVLVSVLNDIYIIAYFIYFIKA